MTEAVIAKINFITNQDAGPGDVAMEHFDFVRIKVDVNLPGVNLPWLAESAKTPGVGTIDQEPMMPDQIDDDVDVGIDFDSHEPQDEAQLVQLDNDALEPVLTDTLGAELGGMESSVAGILGCIFLFQEYPFLGPCFSFLPGFLRIPQDSFFFRRNFFTGTSFWLDFGIPNYSGISGILRNSCSRQKKLT